MNYLDFARGEKVFDDLNRRRSEVLSQRVTNFEEYSVRRQKMSLFKLRGEVQSFWVVLISLVYQSNHERRVNKNISQ